jgi:hypothetical protein
MSGQCLLSRCRNNSAKRERKSAGTNGPVKNLPHAYPETRCIKLDSVPSVTTVQMFGIRINKTRPGGEIPQQTAIIFYRVLC